MQTETQNAVDALIAGLGVPNTWTVTESGLTHKAASTTKLSVGRWGVNLQPIPLHLTLRQRWQLWKAVKTYVAITVSHRLNGKATGSEIEQKDTNA